MDVGCTPSGFGPSTMTLQPLLGLNNTLSFLKSYPLAWEQQSKGGPICPSTAYQGAKILWIHMTWMWDALQVGLEPKPWSYISLGLNNTLIFLKSTPEDLHMHNNVRVPPYGPPQHNKMLKHFIYIWYEFGMQSMGVWSLKHDTTISFELNRRHFGEILGAWWEYLL